MSDMAKRVKKLSVRMTTDQSDTVVLRAAWAKLMADMESIERTNKLLSAFIKEHPEADRKQWLPLFREATKDA